ncbi:hypothetical protein BGP_0860 [Beggiatoa sp. PS]|nr:hypothetical protein BGP_0860 [Beggiatoa sp. PS]
MVIQKIGNGLLTHHGRFLVITHGYVVEGYPKRSGLNFGVFEFVCGGWERKWLFPFGSASLISLSQFLYFKVGII